MIKAALNILILFALTVCTSCVTVKLGPSGDEKRAIGIKIREPSAPFVKDPQAEVDAAWKNPRNGNTISYLSDCADPTDPPLDHIVQGTLSGLNELHYEINESPTVQDRDGRHVLATGKVDGVPSMIELLVFKRNTCIYILSYVGVKKSFNENRAQFKGFLEGFVAP